MSTRLRLISGFAVVLIGLQGSKAEDPIAPIKLDSVLVTLVEHVEVASQEAGILAKLAVKEGSMVQTDAMLAQVDDIDARIAESKARIELEIAKVEAANSLKVRIAQKAYEVAQAELRRAKESVANYPKSVSGTEMDRLTLTADKTAFEVEQAKHELRIAQLNAGLKQNEVEQAGRKVARRQVRAPLEGMVMQIHRHAGEWVEPGEKVLRLARINRLRVEGFLSSKDAASGRPGMPVRLSVDGPAGTARPFQGVVTFVSPEINPVNGQVRLWAEFDNPDLHLRPGMRGTLEILRAAK